MALCSPKTQRTASEMLLLPLPLGPTIAVMPSEKSKFILSANDLKPFTLIPSQKDENGKTIEKPVKYIADFVYKTKNGVLVVEDTKGVRTADYIIKRKLMLYIHKIRIKEI